MKLAIVAYHFPPDTAVGAMRAMGLAKYLSALGHEVTVLSAQESPPDAPYRVLTVPGVMPSVRLKRRFGMGQHESVASLAPGAPSAGIAYRAAKWLIRLTRELVFWPDEARGWGRRVSRTLGPMLTSGRMDAVISTGPPFSAHLAVLRAQGIADVTWIADFRDLWTQSPHYAFSALRKRIDRRAEASIVNGASCVTVVTDTLNAILRKHYPAAHVETVYNGFDPDLFSSACLPRDDARMRVLYAGNLHGGRRDPSPVLAAVAESIADGDISRDGLCIDFYSPAEPALTDAIARYGLGSVCRVHGTCPRAVVLEQYCGSDVLMLLQWADPRESEALPAKAFEYLGARRFILSCGAPQGGEVARFLADTGAGVNVTNVGEARAALMGLWEEYQRSGAIAWPGDESAASAYTHQGMAQRMECILGEHSFAASHTLGPGSAQE